MKTYTERVKNSENYVTTDNEATVAALYAWNEKQKVFTVETCSTDLPLFEQSDLATIASLYNSQKLMCSTPQLSLTTVKLLTMNISPWIIYTQR